MKRKKVAWGITGAGDKILETIKVMKKIKKEYQKPEDVNEVFAKYFVKLN